MELSIHSPCAALCHLLRGALCPAGPAEPGPESAAEPGSGAVGTCPFGAERAALDSEGEALEAALGLGSRARQPTDCVGE